ncbi:MAG: hypothetical protein GWO20_01330 [Candidatus Korarchaeota archaeon]|nr:hypothetical protein [Candidatus Korarchaeota archaeon]NIU83087.1 hypothetical protein [Candidatus Thorarchaeota archaeon]NIW12631.1 hypothetical protein [Candidatus Thorarchaeota archaeon]NIW50842.1 hypothetical protein [Candidatus Korarchaeota archaeon]
MDTKVKLLVVITCIFLYCSVVVWNPYVAPENKTVFTEEDMDVILEVYGKKGSTEPVSPTVKGDETREFTFDVPVREVRLHLKKNVLDSEPYNIRFTIAILSEQSLLVNITVVKVLDVHPERNQNIEKSYYFPSNESKVVSLRVWPLRGQRNTTTMQGYQDRIEITALSSGSQHNSNRMRGIRLYSFSYTYYTEGKRGESVPSNVKTVGVLYAFLIALFLPFGFWFTMLLIDHYVEKGERDEHN